VRKVLAQEADMRAVGPNFVADGEETPTTLTYRDHINSEGSPSELITTSYTFTPGTELAADGADAIH
jgi:hypothetical protein